MTAYTPSEPFSATTTKPGSEPDSRDDGKIMERAMKTDQERLWEMQQLICDVRGVWERLGGERMPWGVCSAQEAGIAVLTLASEVGELRKAIRGVSEAIQRRQQNFAGPLSDANGATESDLLDDVGRALEEIPQLILDLALVPEDSVQDERAGKPDDSKLLERAVLDDDSTLTERTGPDDDSKFPE